MAGGTGMGMGMGGGAAVGSTPRPMAGQTLGGGAPRAAQQPGKSGGGAFGDLDVFSM